MKLVRSQSNPGGAGRAPGPVDSAAVGWLLIAGGLFASCSFQESDTASIKSRFFERVEVIGTRGGGLGQFNKPRSVAVDADDNLFVVDMTGRVQKFSPDGEFLDYWQMPVTELGKPKGMSQDEQGNIVVLEPHYSRVNHFTPGGQLLEQWGRHGTDHGSLAFPRAVAVTAKGDVFVSEYGITERIQLFRAHDRSLALVIGPEPPAAVTFNRPEGLGLDIDGRLYVADSCNHRILIFAPDGTPLRSHGRAGRGPGEFSYPYDVRVDSAGRQFVCEFGNSRIQIFDANDQPLEILGGAGPAPGQLNNPWAIALDSFGNLYVADSMNHRVQKFIARNSGRRSGRPRLVARVTSTQRRQARRDTDRLPALHGLP
jgi:DNA-binding beta-propeller fold protein YncE